MSPRNHPNDDRSSFERKRDDATDELNDFITSPKGLVIVGVFIAGGAIAIIVNVVRAVIDLF